MVTELLLSARSHGGPWGHYGKQKAQFLTSKTWQSSVCVVGYRAVLTLLFISCVILGKLLDVSQPHLLAEGLKGDCPGESRLRHHWMWMPWQGMRQEWRSGWAPRGYWCYWHIFFQCQGQVIPCWPCQGERQLPPKTVSCLEGIVWTFPKEKKTKKFTVGPN